LLKIGHLKFPVSKVAKKNVPLLTQIDFQDPELIKKWKSWQKTSQTAGAAAAEIRKRSARQSKGPKYGGRMGEEDKETIKDPRQATTKTRTRATTTTTKCGKFAQGHCMHTTCMHTRI